MPPAGPPPPPPTVRDGGGDGGATAVGAYPAANCRPGPPGGVVSLPAGPQPLAALPQPSPRSPVAAAKEATLLSPPTDEGLSDFDGLKFLDNTGLVSFGE